MYQATRVVLLAFVFFVILLSLMLPSVAIAKDTVVRVGTGSIGGNYFVTSQALAKVCNVNKDAYGFRCKTEATTGSVSNIKAIMAGEVELGIVQSDCLFRAVKGLGEWKDKGPQEDLRALFGLYTESVTLVASAKSGIKTIQDLKGKRVHMGHPGSGGRNNAIAVLEAAGINWKKDIGSYGKLPNPPGLFIEDKIDAFFYTVGHPNTDISMVTLGKKNTWLVPITNIEKLISSRPFYTKSFIPIKLYPNALNWKDVETFGVKAVLVASAKTSEHVVYSITKEIFENRESFTIQYPHLQMVSEASMLECLTALIHSGALKYYDEAKVQLPPSCLLPGQ
jgi:TRAP transporter TAXI family solute receptor